MASVIVVVVIFTGLCGIFSEDTPEIEGTEGMIETAGEFQTQLRGSVKYRIFRHRRQDPNPRTRSLLRRAVTASEQYMATDFPAKTVVLIFDDDAIPADTIGQVRALPGASFFATISHSLSARWVRIEIRPEQESNSDGLKSVLSHEVAHYYWHHHAFDVGTTDFDLDEGAAHFLEYKLGDNYDVWVASQLAKLCVNADPRSGPDYSEAKGLVSALELEFSPEQIERILSDREFIKFFTQLCSDHVQFARYIAAGAFIRAEEIMGSRRFQRAFREIWELSKGSAGEAVDANDVHDILCEHAGSRKCVEISDAFEAFGFKP